MIDPPERRLERCPDGSVRQRSAITGTVVWTLPGRSARPVPAPRTSPRPIADDRDDQCAFCPGNYRQTPPERARLLLEPGGPRMAAPDAGAPDAGAPDGRRPWRVLRDLPAEQLDTTVADVRWFPNLFPILPFEHWHANHGCPLPAAALARTHEYAATPGGRSHLLQLARQHLPAPDPASGEVQLAEADVLRERFAPMFASTHDVVVARRHYVSGATQDDQVASAGDLTSEEHHAYLALSVDALTELTGANPYVRYVAVFQNWLRPAGASFDHLHRQLVGIDALGPQVERALALVAAEPDLFTTRVLQPAARDGLVVAGNDHAVAVAGVGHRYPTIELYSRSPGLRPWEHSAEALRGISDLLHACHAATGRTVPTNEEWHYRPVGDHPRMPWRINLKWRISTLAGFEGATSIYVNTLSPFDVRDRVVQALARLRDSGRVSELRIGAEATEGPAPGAGVP